MSSILEQIKYRAKAIIATAGIAFVALAEWAVQSPDTAAALERVVPAPYAQFVPLILGALAAVLVHQVPNGAAPATASVAPVVEPPTETTLLRAITTNSGEFIGDAAH